MVMIAFMAKPCCERSEPTSAEGAASRAWGAESPPRFRGARIAGQFLAAGENLALRENSSPSSCVSPAAVAVANCLIRFVCAERGVGYKVDISKTKSGYKVDTIVSNL